MKRSQHLLFVALLLVPMLAAGLGLVRAAAPPTRYTTTAGVVLDNCTGLHWQQGHDAGQGWTNAAAYCQNNTAGLSGTNWRLPTIKELQSIVDETVLNPSIDTATFTAVPDCYWSSSKVAGNSGLAWAVFFSSGGTTSFGLANPCRVRCVR
ncbi:MAG: DUF1566 domain-containing protein [Deltaproteobacteria bacterium]|nr:DUF1566 domain-containing protein [Deltaproteobacteria bacterium]